MFEILPETTNHEYDRLMRAAENGYNTVAATAINGFIFQSMPEVVEYLLCKWHPKGIIKDAYHINKKWLCIKFHELAPIEARIAVYKTISKGVKALENYIILTDVIITTIGDHLVAMAEDYPEDQFGKLLVKAIKNAADDLEYKFNRLKKENDHDN